MIGGQPATSSSDALVIVGAILLQIVRSAGLWNSHVPMLREDSTEMAKPEPSRDAAVEFAKEHESDGSVEGIQLIETISRAECSDRWSAARARRRSHG